MSRSLTDPRDPVGVAINVGANSSLPGVRGRLFSDGSFEYIPIPERKPTAEWVPTYEDLGVEVPDELLNRPVHLDPSFASYPCCEGYTYGDEHGVKAAPLGRLCAGDFVWFYASLTPVDPRPGWAPPDWGAFIIGEFRLACDPIIEPTVDDVPAEFVDIAESNAHFKRQRPDAKVLVIGDHSSSRLFDRAIPLSSDCRGVEPNSLVTEHSSDSGAGPWWRRPLRFDEAGTHAVRQVIGQR